jgi:outer membrane biosynthesis protein TonB
MENELETDNRVEEPENKPNQPEPESEAPAPEIDDSREVIAGLEQALAGKDGEINALNQSLTASKGESAELAKALAQTVAAYRELVVQANPNVLAEMISGDSIEKINESLKSARAVMDKARREIEADALKARIPAGAPQRMPPDMSALSAREKIQYALGG